MAKGTKLTTREYSKIKELLNEGRPGKVIAEFMGRSVATISSINDSMDFKDYTQKMWQKYIRTTKYLERHPELSLKPQQTETTPDPVAEEVKEPVLDALKALEMALDGLKELIGQVIEEQVKLNTQRAVEQQMKTVRVELNELRRLKEDAKAFNWAESLQKKLSGKWA